jgi:nicotinamidase-related amidase
MSLSSTDKGLLTPENCALVLIDFQSQLLACLSDAEREALLVNVMTVAKAARIFKLPVILSALESREFGGEFIPELRELFPQQPIIRRTSMNAWDCPEFVTAVRKTGLRNVIAAAAWSESSLVFPVLQMMEEGYYLYLAEDASFGIRPASHAIAIRRMAQAGAVSLSAVQVLLELQRDWARSEQASQVIDVMRTHSRVFTQHDSTSPLQKANPSRQTESV